MKNLFKNLFKKKVNQQPNFKWKKVRVQNEFKFRKYSDNNLLRLKSLSGKVVMVKKISNFFYLIKDKDVVIFMADFKSLDDDDYRKQIWFFFQ